MNAPPLSRPLRAILQRRLQTVPSRPTRTPYYLRATHHHCQPRCYSSKYARDLKTSRDRVQDELANRGIRPSDQNSKSQFAAEQTSSNEQAQEPAGASEIKPTEGEQNVNTKFEVPGHDAESATTAEAAVPRLDGLFVKSAFQQLKTVDEEIRSGIADAVARQLESEDAATAALRQAQKAEVPREQAAGTEEVQEAQTLADDVPEVAEAVFADQVAAQDAEPVTEKLSTNGVASTETTVEPNVSEAVDAESPAAAQTAPPQPAVPGLEMFANASPEEIAALMAQLQQLRGAKTAPTEVPVEEAPKQQESKPEAATSQPIEPSAAEPAAADSAASPETVASESVASGSQSSPDSVIEEIPTAEVTSKVKNPEIGDTAGSAEEAALGSAKSETRPSTDSILEEISAEAGVNEAQSQREQSAKPGKPRRGEPIELKSKEELLARQSLPKRLREVKAILAQNQESKKYRFKEMLTLDSARSRLNEVEAILAQAQGPYELTHEGEHFTRESLLHRLNELGAIVAQERGRYVIQEPKDEPKDEDKEQPKDEEQPKYKEQPKDESSDESPRLPRNVQAFYLQPLRRVAEYGVPSCDLQLRSYSVRPLEFFCDFALRAAYYLGLPAHGPIPLPKIIERWTVPKSSFIFKKSQENFERITRRRLIQIKDGHPETVQIWLAFLQKHQQAAVGMKANIWEFSSVDVAKQLDEAYQEAKPLIDDQARFLGQNKEFATVEKVDEFLQSEKYRLVGGLHTHKEERVERNQTETK